MASVASARHLASAPWPGQARAHRAAATTPAARRPAVRCRSAMEGNPLFNEQFMSVLQGSLSRQGSDSLYQGAEPAEPRASANEEVLEHALAQSKSTLAIMCQWRDQLDKQIAVQQKQVERVEFALQKARSDAAYTNALKEMLHDS